MKRLIARATAGLAAAAFAGAAVLTTLAPPAAAAPFSGTTTLLDAPVSGSTLMVEASLTSNGPVVAYGYALQNECAFPQRTGRSYQRDDIVYWTFEVGGVPHTTMPVYLQSVPAGSKCKVFLIKNNTVVKGSTTSYTVS
jgi:hypothetical protein